MDLNSDILVTLPGGRRVDVQVGRHTVHTDQPASLGGEDTAPAPFELFLASLGSCVGVFVQGFCAKRGIPYEGIRIQQRAEFDEEGNLRGVELEVQLPAGFPEKYRDAVVRVAEKCSVKQAIQAQPTFVVRATGG